MGDDGDDKKAEVRRKLQEEAESKKKKKGFMTPARKSKLRMLLRKKAAEELKKEEARRKEERIRLVKERCGEPKKLDGLDEEMLIALVTEYYQRILVCESQKYDFELQVYVNEYEITELNRKVQDLRGRFIRPQLKKVSKYEDKFAKLNKTANEFSIKAKLKHVEEPKVEDGSSK